MAQPNGHTRGQLTGDQQRKALQRFMDGESYNQIGASYGVSRQTIGGLVHRARMAGKLPWPDPEEERKRLKENKRKSDNRRAQTARANSRAAHPLKIAPEHRLLEPLTPPTMEQVMRAYASAIVISSRSPETDRWMNRMLSAA